MIYDISLGKLLVCKFQHHFNIMHQPSISSPRCFRPPAFWCLFDSPWFASEGTQAQPYQTPRIFDGGHAQIARTSKRPTRLGSCMDSWQMDVEPKIGGFYPQKWMVKIMEKPMNKWMIWGYPYFWKHPNRHKLLWFSEQVRQYAIVSMFHPCCLWWLLLCWCLAVWDAHGGSRLSPCIAGNWKEVPIPPTVDRN